MFTAKAAELSFSSLRDELNPANISQPRDERRIAFLNEPAACRAVSDREVLSNAVKDQKSCKLVGLKRTTVVREAVIGHTVVVKGSVYKC